MAELAPLLGKPVPRVDSAKTKAGKIIGKPVEPQVLDLAGVDPGSRASIRMLALMERHDAGASWPSATGCNNGSSRSTAVPKEYRNSVIPRFRNR